MNSQEPRSFDDPQEDSKRIEKLIKMSFTGLFCVANFINYTQI